MLSKEELEGYCKKHYSLVYKYCMSRLSNKSDAEDATQETFVIFSRKAHLIEQEHIVPWLLTTAHHMVLKELKRRALAKKKVNVFDEEMTAISGRVRTFEEDLIDCYIDKYMTEIYARLNEREKELFDFYSDGNMKTGDIAQLMGLDPHACSMRKQRLKEKCREIMMEILFY